MSTNHLDELFRESWQIFADRLSSSPRGEPFTLTGEERNMLLIRLRQSVDMAIVVDAMAETLRATLIEWRETPEEIPIEISTKKKGKKLSAER